MREIEVATGRGCRALRMPTDRSIEPPGSRSPLDIRSRAVGGVNNRFEITDCNDFTEKENTRRSSRAKPNFVLRLIRCRVAKARKANSIGQIMYAQVH